MSVQAFEDALARVLGSPGGRWVRADTSLEDIGIDALARVLLVDACGDAGIDVDADSAWSARTVADLADSARRSAT